MRKAVGEFMELTAPIYEVMQFMFIFIYLFYILYPVPVLPVFYLTTFIFNAIFFIVYKDFLKNFNIAWGVGVATVLVAVAGLPTYLSHILEQKTGFHVNLMIKLMFTLCFLMFLTVFLFVDIKKKKEAVKNLKVGELISSMGKVKDSEHDVNLCTDTEGNTVVLRENDRFVHMMINGPTGCGKTSMVLLPMIKQDIEKKHALIVMEPKGDLVRDVYALGVYYNAPVIYVNPTDPDCPKFNPLDGEEVTIIETMKTIFNMLSPESSTYYKNLSDNLIDKSIKVLKRIEQVYMDEITGISKRPATLMSLSDLIQNTSNRGREMIKELKKIPAVNEEEKKENEDIAEWFENDYYNSGPGNNIYRDSSNVRTQVSILIQNEYLRNVFNPTTGKSDFSFDEILEKGGRIAICTAQGVLKSRHFGLFLMLAIQSAVFRRGGTEFDRIPCYLYLDEFQTYANDSFGQILEQGRSYRVAAILATQSRSRIKNNMGRDGENFLATVSANARNIIAFPGLDPNDLQYFEGVFGYETIKELQKSESRQKYEFGHGFKETNYPTESVREVEVEKARYTATEIGEAKFGEFHYRLIENKNVGRPGKGIVKWIDKDINNRIKQIAASYDYEQQQKALEQKRRKEEIRKQKNRDYMAQVNGGARTMATSNENPGIKVEGGHFGSAKDGVASSEMTIPDGIADY